MPGCQVSVPAAAPAPAALEALAAREVADPADPVDQAVASAAPSRRRLASTCRWDCAS